MLTYGPADPANPEGSWEVAITALDGSQRQPLPGVRDGSFSPDGAKLAYSLIDGGILIRDLATGEDLPVPGTANGDFNPIWSPDGADCLQRGMGIFRSLHRQPGWLEPAPDHGGVEGRWAGWRMAVSSTPCRAGSTSTSFTAGTSPAAKAGCSNENIQSLSPDGQYVAIAVLAFGERWQIDISRLDGADRWALANDSLWA